jgi:hypothetical protein
MNFWKIAQYTRKILRKTIYILNTVNAIWNFIQNIRMLGNIIKLSSNFSHRSYIRINKFISIWKSNIIISADIILIVILTVSHVDPVVWQNERTVDRNLINKIFSQNIVCNVIEIIYKRRIISPITKIRNIYSFFIFSK